MVSGKLYVLTGSTVKAIDPKTGTVTATSEKLAGTSQFGTNPIAYGDGKFYIQLDANTSDEKAHVAGHRRRDAQERLGLRGL